MTSAAAADLPTLPTLSALRAAVSDGKTAPPDNHTPPLLPEVLDILFEPSATLHSIAVPALVEALEEGDDDGSDDVAGYERLVNVVKSKLLALAETASTAGGGDDATAARGKLHHILGSHPRLGRKPVTPGGEAEKLSALSAAEQGKMRAASSGSGSGPSSEEAEKEEEELARLNAEYEARFPGLRYVTWVNGRPRRVILEDMRERIDKGDLEEEERRGVEAICDIAVDRAKKLLKAAAKAS